MKMEVRTFDDLVLVSQVARYTPAERTGLVAGDLILSFGIHAPSKVTEDPDLIGLMKRSEWLFILRGTVAFRLSFGEGIEGAQFEVGKPAENINVPGDGAWPHYWCGMQSSGQMILVPETFSPWWGIVPPLLYARFRNWQMLAAIVLVWLVALVQGPVAFVLAYLVSVALAMFGGASLMRDALLKQGYLARGTYQVARTSDLAALEITTADQIRQARLGQSPKPAGDGTAQGAAT